MLIYSKKRFNFNWVFENKRLVHMCHQRILSKYTRYQ